MNHNDPRGCKRCCGTRDRSWSWHRSQDRVLKRTLGFSSAGISLKEHTAVCEYFESTLNEMTQCSNQRRRCTVWAWLSLTIPWSWFWLGLDPSKSWSWSRAMTWSLVWLRWSWLQHCDDSLKKEISTGVIHGSTDFKVLGLFCPFLVCIYIYFFLLNLCFIQFLAAVGNIFWNLILAAGPRVKKETWRCSEGGREGETSQEWEKCRDRENGGRTQREGLNLIWRETDSAVW